MGANLNVKEETVKTFEKINGGSICPPRSKTEQGLSNIKKDSTCHISVYIMNKDKIVFLSKNILIKSNKDVRLRIRFDQKGRLGLRSISSK